MPQKIIAQAEAQAQGEFVKVTGKLARYRKRGRNDLQIIVKLPSQIAGRRMSGMAPLYPEDDEDAHEIGALRCRCRPCVSDQRRVPVNIADGRIVLGQEYLQSIRHGPSWCRRTASIVEEIGDADYPIPATLKSSVSCANSGAGGRFTRC